MKSGLARTTLLCALAGAASCACSSPSEPNQGHEIAGSGGASAGSSPTAGSATGGATNTGGVNTGGSATTGGSAGANASAGSAAGGSSASGHSGQITFFNLLAQKYQNLTASFVKDSTPGPDSKSCEETTVGSCSAFVCPEGFGGGSVTYATAGVVTVTSPEVMGSATLMPAADGSYSMPQVDFQHLFTGLEHINFKVTGGEVPTFEAELDMPLVLLLSSPLYVKDTPGIDAQRNQDLTLTWTRGTENELFYLSGGGARLDGQPGLASLTCQFPSLTGTGTVSAALLQKLAPDTNLSLYTTAFKVVQAGDYAVTLVNVHSVANPDKVAVPNIHLL